MTTSSRVKLGWEVPNDRWAEYTDKVEAKWGDTRLYAGIQIEESWREYRDIHPLESYTNRLLEVAGLSREADGKNNLPGIPSLADTKSSRQYVRVHEDVKHGMEQYAAANGLSKHEVLRGVIAWYLGGSTEERLIDKLERIVPEAERAFAEVTDDGPNTPDGLSKSERVTRKIARSLSDRFFEDDLETAIDAKTSGSDYYHREYKSRVVKYKGVKRWETDNNPDVFLPPEMWKTKKTKSIIFNLGGDIKTLPPAFTKDEFAEAAEGAGIEVNMENWESVNEYKKRVLKYIEFGWSDETEQFEPVDDWDAETELNPVAAEMDDVESYDVGDSDVDTDADTESATVSDRMDKLEDATKVRTDGSDGEV